MLKQMIEVKRKEIIQESKNKGYKHIAIKLITEPEEMSNVDNGFEFQYQEFSHDVSAKKKYFSQQGYEIVNLLN